MKRIKSALVISWLFLIFTLSSLSVFFAEEAAAQVKTKVALLSVLPMAPA
jgi:hypothetical protein